MGLNLIVDASDFMFPWECQNRFAAAGQAVEDGHHSEVSPSMQGINTDSLVEHSIGLVSRAERDGSPYDEVWIAFDRGSSSGSTFGWAFEVVELLNELGELGPT